MTTRRPKPPQSTWLIEQRKRRGWRPEDVADRLDVAVATIRGWESGRGIGPDSMTRLEMLFGVQSPAVGQAGQPDLAAALTALVEELRAMRQEREGMEARVRALEAEVRSHHGQPGGAGFPMRSVPRGSGG